MPWRACYLSKVPYCSSLSTGKIWVFLESYITLQKTNWFLISSLLPPLFLLQHYSCVISALGGFQEQTGYSPEQPGLASELLLLWEQVGALVRSLLTWIIPWSFLAVSFCLLSAVFQDFLYKLGTFIQRLGTWVFYQENNLSCVMKDTVYCSKISTSGRFVDYSVLIKMLVLSNLLLLEVS